MSLEPEIAAWARKVLAKTDAVILDTETTGLHNRAEVVQIGILSMAGQVLLDTLVKPTCAIPLDAQRIHRITDAMVADAPTIADLLPQLRELLGGARVIIYNAAYDTRILEQSLRAHSLVIDVPLFGASSYDCAMEAYAEWVGDWSSYHQSYRYQRLPGGDHTAIGDSRACLAVLRRMAGIKEETANERDSLVQG